MVLAVRWSSRTRVRKPLAASGHMLASLSIGVIGLARASLSIVAARAASQLARGLQASLCDAALTDAVHKEQVDRALGFRRAMEIAGGVIGPLVTIALFSMAEVRQVFFWAAIPGVVGAVVLWVAVKRPSTKMTVVPPPLGASLSEVPLHLDSTLVAIFVFGIGDFAHTFLIWNAIELLAPTLGEDRALMSALVLYAVRNFAFAVASYPIHRLARRLAPRRLLVVGYALGAAVAILAAVPVPSLALLSVLFVLAGIARAFKSILERPTVAALAESDVPGPTSKALTYANGAGGVLSNLLVGLLLTFGPTVPFGFAAAACLGGTVLLATENSRSPNSIQR